MKTTKNQITFTLVDGKVQTDISDDLIKLQIPFGDLIKAKLIMEKIFKHYQGGSIRIK